MYEGSDIMDSFETTIVDSDTIVEKDIKKSLISICEDLEERGYNPIKQIVAYLISGDPGYISSYKECRSRLLQYKREDILEVVLVKYIRK